MGLKPGSGRSPGEGNGKLLQYSCLGNPMDRGAWRATVHGFAKSQTQLSSHTHVHTHTHPYIINSLFKLTNFVLLFLAKVKLKELSLIQTFTYTHTQPPPPPHTHRLTFLSCFLITSYQNTINMRNGIFLAISVNKGCCSH